MLALEGIRILDLTRVGPGSFCTMVLGDLGAEVIKIESPPEPGTRQGGAFHSPEGEEGRRQAAYNCLDRNKKSIVLSLRSEAGKRIFYQLVETADVIVEAFRPGVAERLGINYERVSKANPGIVYCSITGYGQDGPYQELLGHDINYISMAGALGMIGEPGGEPVIPLSLLANHGGGGMNAVIGILSALIARTNTGKGQYVDIALADSVLSLLAWNSVKYFCHDVVPGRGENVEGGAYPYYNRYKTRDGKYIAIGCIEPWLWENLCREIGREEFIPFHFKSEHLLYPPDGREWQEVSSYLGQVFLTKTRDEWFEQLRQKDIPVAKVYSLDEVFTDPQVLHRRMVIEEDDATVGKVRQVGIAIKLSATPGEIRSLSPVLGEHTEQVLGELGYNREGIDRLRQEGTVA